MDQEKNALLNLVNHQPDIDTIHQCAKDPCEAKHDDKKIHIFNGTSSCLYSTNAEIVCQIELLKYIKIKVYILSRKND